MPKRYLASALTLAGTRQDKAAAIAYCARRYPAASLLATPRSRTPHTGLADALCLAEWGRRISAQQVPQWIELQQEGAAVRQRLWQTEGHEPIWP